MIKKIIKKSLNYIKDIFSIILLVYPFLKSSVLHGMVGMKKRIPGCHEKVIIVGNGPSAATFNFFREDLKNYSILCVNYFALKNNEFYQIKPKYYCLIDDLFYQEKDKEAKALIECFKKVDWEMHLILLDRQKLNINNVNIKYIYLNTTIYHGTLFRNFLYKNNLATDGFQNVMNAAIYYAITARVEEVYLIGVENDWHRELYVDDNNDVIRMDRHFYDTVKLNLVEKGEIAKGELYKYFYWYYLTLKHYAVYRKYADCIGTKIYNITPSSYIDVFERREL